MARSVVQNWKYSPHLEVQMVTICDYARKNAYNQHSCLKTSCTVVTLIMRPFFNSASKLQNATSQTNVSLFRSCVLQVSKSLEAELGDIIHCCKCKELVTNIYQLTNCKLRYTIILIKFAMFNKNSSILNCDTI